MPRINRRVRARQQTRLTDAQRELLIFGQLFLHRRDEGFETREQERAAWKLHRNELMANMECPGRRPHAYYEHDLGMDRVPVRWPDEVRALLERNLIDLTEAHLVERTYQILSPDQSPTLYSHIARYPAKADGTSQAMLQECELAVMWHRWRGCRAELVTKYEAIVQALKG